MPEPATPPPDPPDPLAPFGPVTRAWFAGRFGAPTRVQAEGWRRISAGEHTLMLAPTGSGKTLAAFLACLDRLSRAPRAAPVAGYRVVYVSPLKALAYDVERNLTVPLAGLAETAAAAGVALAPIRVDVRTGDTPPDARRRQLRDPGDILITTPESLYLLLGSRARAHLAAVETVIVDEIHALAPVKRGAHLALSLERLSHHVVRAGGAEPQRIGLSATQRPLAVVARYLGGDRAVAVLDAGEPPRLDLQIVVPVDDMTRPPPDPAQPEGALPPSEQRSLWPALYAHLLDLILGHRSTIVFTQSRRLAERLAQQLSELAVARGAIAAGEPLVRAHHGSVARHEREVIEAALKAGQLRALCATSSLELGIDMGAVDLVVQIESPGGVARGLQRIGRASHHVGGTPRGRLLPTHRADLLEAAAVVRGMRDGAVEAVALPESCLDVLAQQVVAMCAVEPWPVADLARVIRRAAGYAGLGPAGLAAVLDMLAGRYPSDDFAELRPRLAWDRATNVLTARRGAHLLSVVNAGTIPDRGLYAVHLGADGPRIGELDEEMVFESRAGETFVLGASTWRIDEITRDRVIVRPAPGEPGKMPFWRGEGPGRPVELGRAMGALTRTIDDALAAGADADLAATLRARHDLDDRAATNLIAHVAAQRAAAGAVPTDRAITVERFRDELGDWRICILSPLGARVHAPWALALGRELEARLGYPIHPLVNDDGIALRIADGDAPPDDAALFPDPDRVEDLVVAELSQSAVFAARFREAAARALLLPRRRPGHRTPLWTQRLRAQQLLGVALRYPSFPIVLEAYRECLRDVFDLPALVELLAGVRARAIRIDAAETTAPSPFARSLVFDYVGAYLYGGDAPVAERRAHALTLDRGLLRELLGEAEARRLVDRDVIAEVTAERQGLAEDRRARDADEVHDLLRRLGDLADDEVAARAATPTAVAGWLAELAAARRAIAIEVAGAPRWIAIEDAARYRDALGVAVPADLPGDLAAPAPDAALGLVARFARGRGPFRAADAAARLGLPPAQVALALGVLEDRGAVVSGALDPDGDADAVEHCDAEVWRALRRRTLERLRREAAAVPAAALARFLPRWHGVGAGPGARGPAALRDAIARLEGVALPFAELEARLLPARVADYQPAMLDELGASGELVWAGRGQPGASDGAVVLCRRERAPLLLEPPTLPDDASALARAIVAHLEAAGASFLVALETATGADRDALRATLRDLVWAGVVTNDTFAPLRQAAAKARPRGRLATPRASFGGRWSLVAPLLRGAPAPTARAHARAAGLLDRWGVVSRDAVIADDLPGGFAGVAGVLRAMEDAGKVRRGHFVDGLAGAQYAWPGALDRLRAAREPAADGPEVLVLAALDPASPWGTLLPWPPAPDGARIQRRAGAMVVQVDGACALWVDPRGKKLVAFTGGLDDDAVDAALRRGLRRVAALARRRSLTIETIDGRPALASPLAARLERLGARKEYRGVTLAVDGA